MEKRRILAAASSAGIVFAMTISTVSSSRGLPARPIAADDIKSFPASDLSDCGPGRNVAWLVRVVIEDTNIPRLKRAIRYEASDPNRTEDQENDDDARYDASQENTTNDPEYQNNPFNIDLTTITGRNDKIKGKFVKVRVIAKDTRYKFYEFNDRRVIAYGNAKGKAMFCSDHPKQNRNGRSVAIFYVRLEEGPKYDGVGLYNFALQAKDATTTTPAMIVIDPKVKNNG